MPDYMPDCRRPASFVDRLFRLFYRLVYPLWRGHLLLLRRRTHGTQVAVWCEHQLLLVRNSYRRDYTFPGGYLRKGEAPILAASRELREETGLCIGLEQLQHLGSLASRDGRSIGHNDLFECRLKQMPLLYIDNREVIEARFVTREQAKALPLATHVSQYLCGHLAVHRDG